jgi:hypothetical protein
LTRKTNLFSEAKEIQETPFRIKYDFYFCFFLYCAYSIPGENFVSNNYGKDYGDKVIPKKRKNI